MNTNQIKAAIVPAAMGIIGWTANSAVQLCSSYLKGGDNHTPITVNSGGTLPSSGGTTYIDARQSDFTSVVPYMTSAFLAGVAFMYYVQQHQVNQDMQVANNAHDVAVQAVDHGVQVANNAHVVAVQVVDQGIQVANDVQDVAVQAVDQGIQVGHHVQDVAVQAIDPERLLID